MDITVSKSHTYCSLSVQGAFTFTHPKSLCDAYICCGEKSLLPREILLLSRCAIFSFCVQVLMTETSVWKKKKKRP